MEAIHASAALSEEDASDEDSQVSIVLHADHGTGRQHWITCELFRPLFFFF